MIRDAGARLRMGCLGSALLLCLVLLGSCDSAGIKGITTAPTAAGDGWKRLVSEDFTKDAATGSWGSSSNPYKVVYTGDSGTRWVTYPENYTDTTRARPYRSDEVLSVHDGVLDYDLGTVDGRPAAANPSPLIAGNSQYQTYGQYSARVRVTNQMQGFYIVFLLWPQNEANWQCAESDFPEQPLSSVDKVSSFAHYGCEGAKQQQSTPVDLTSWHTYTQQWGPGFRRYLIDGKEVSRSTRQVYDQPQRWQLQLETVPTEQQQDGHVYVDWITVDSHAGAEF